MDDGGEFIDLFSSVAEGVFKRAVDDVRALFRPV